MAAGTGGGKPAILLRTAVIGAAETTIDHIMGPELQAHVAFHLTGRRLGGGLEASDQRDLRPALFAPFRDLTRLRYDFPVVLVSGRADETCLQSLTAVVNGVLGDVAPRGIPGERIRQRVLRLEREIRALVAGGSGGRLSALWDTGAARLIEGADATMKNDLERARAALKVDGEVLDCTPDLPVRLFTHVWRGLQERKAITFELEIRRLIVKLSGILQAEFARSTAGRSAASLEASLGAGLAGEFDFEAMSGVLASVTGKDPLPAARRQRIERALSVLESHQSLAKSGAGAKPGAFHVDACLFESCREAATAFRNRLPELIDLVKAIAIAELEIEGGYVEAMHDPFFADFDENSVGAKDLALFPDYLVRIRTGALHGSDGAELVDVLSSGTPIKILVQSSEILEEPSLREGHLGFLTPSAQIGKMATGLDGVYVLQSASSHLYQLRPRILKGLASTGPALFSVFSGAARSSAGLSPYLVAAAAMQSRAFPAFTFDPEAGADGASRFSLEDNPQPAADWPVHDLAYEDAGHQGVSEKVAFTFVDFVACDPRYAKHFAIVPQPQWNGSMLPAGDRLTAQAAADKIPYVQMVDGNDVLQRALVDEKLIGAAGRCRDMWHSLQELGGIRSAQAERLLARERKVWEEQKQREIDALRREVKSAPSAAAAAPAASAAPPAAQAPATPAPARAEAAEAEPASDEAYIETPRCTTCNECTNLNNRMFAYNENKQAYIANVEAGTYRELVEAAETCQVSIIHPGKPRNPNEPGLAELVKRAEAFR